jgi:hypothetical protein
MRKLCISNLPYLLLAMLLMAMTGCGANSRALNGTNGTSGSVSAKLVVGKGAAAKAVASALPSGIASLQFTVTGSDANGKAIPVVRNTITETVNGKGTVTGIYPGQVTVAVKALSSTGAVVYEGFAINVTVVAGPTPSDAGTIVLSAPLTKAQDANCVACHETTLDVNGQNLVADFKQSGHYTNLAWTANDKFGVTGTGCAGCHGPSHNDSNPATSGRCFECHGTNISAPHRVMGANLETACSKCHAPHNTQILGCIGCHSVPQNATDVGAYVNDNNGVRVITTEFGKWSHHVTGVTLNDAHCAACHLEGKIKDNAVAVDITKHMVDAKIHLRNVDDDSDMQWDPATPNHTTMDNFCLSCHDANGATSPASQTIQAFINANGVVAAGKTASATNPFGDTISNQYDRLQRPAVVDAAGQFNTSNNSHHAVLGKKYSGRSRVSKSGTIADAAFTANSSANLPGARSTIYDAGRFNPTYSTLANAGGETGARNGGAVIGDDSTLHCGDCHTVGQWKANAAMNADGTLAPAAIGAHGSANEYLLRNNIGTDQRHIGQNLTSAAVYISTGKPYLICFNCHKIASYGNGQGHDGERAGSEQCNGPYNTRSEPIPGLLNKISSLTPVAAEYTGIGEDRLKSVITQIGGTTAGAYGAQTTGHGGNLGNIYGIQCANCHNSGVDNGFGGIHGSKVNTYTDALGNTTKHMRFLPGLGNALFVPGTKGGYTGGTSATYKSYSANRNGTGAGGTSGQTFTLLPIRNVPFVTGAKVGSFTYTTGGVTNDLNWEQKTAGLDNGSSSTSQGVSGCYTLDTGLPKINALASAGYPADDVRYAPSKDKLAVDGTPALDNWGGCEDHGGVAGRSSEPFTRGIIRPVSY